MQNRQLIEVLKLHIEKTKKSFLLLGPRQTGKSTIIKSLSPDLVIDLADETTYRDHLKDPGLIRSQATVLNRGGRIMIDEIQRIDFSKLDLREAFEDLMQNFKPGKMDGLNQKINERLEIMKKGLRPKTEPQLRQRNEAW